MQGMASCRRAVRGNTLGDHMAWRQPMEEIRSDAEAVPRRVGCRCWPDTELQDTDTFLYSILGDGCAGRNKGMQWRLAANRGGRP